MRHNAVCVFCGVAFENLLEIHDRQDGDWYQTYDDDLVKSTDADWLLDARVIGENADLIGSDKVFVSGLCVDGYYDVSVLAPPGDDENFPAPEEGEDDVNIRFTVYNWSSATPISFLFHDACYDVVFRNMVKHRLGTTLIDNETLYETLKSFCSVENISCRLECLDYGWVSAYHDHPFYLRDGDEAIVMFPGSHRSILKTYGKLPRLKKGVQHLPTYVVSDESRSNSFASLPTEIIFDIMLHLPLGALRHLRACSERFWSITTLNTFWKQRWKLDMAWAYDMPDYIWLQETDWAVLYRQLHEEVVKCTKRPYLRLANRRRIWVICEPLINEYVTRLREKHRRIKDADCRLLGDAIYSPMPRLIWPQPTALTTSFMPLIRSFLLDSDFCFTLHVFWDIAGHLMGFEANHHQSVERSDTMSSSIVGDENGFTRKDSLTINRESWIIGIQFTLQEDQLVPAVRYNPNWHCVGIEFLLREPNQSIQFGLTKGAKRLLVTSYDHLLVGLKVQWSKSYGICKIGFIQLPLMPGTPAYKSLANTHERMQDSMNGVARWLWQDSLPPIGTELSQPYNDSFDCKPDLKPMHALVFATSQEGLSTITSFSADVRLGAFEVGYADGSKSSIGPCSDALRTLEIDGANGERIVAVGVLSNPSVLGICIHTNRGRYLNLKGFSLEDLPNSFEANCYTAPAGSFLSGFYCNWSLDHRRLARLTVCGTTSLPGSEPELLKHSKIQLRRDEHNLTWDSHPYPAEWTLPGPRTVPHPSYRKSDLSMPQRSARVTWLDCRRPLEKVIAAFVHLGTQKYLKMTSLAFFYSDGHKDVIGPDPVRLKNDIEKETWSPFCACFSHALNLGHTDMEGEEKNHYQVVEWVIGGSRLRDLTIWEGRLPHDVGRPLGLQMTAVNGRQGPRWATCEGAPKYRIRFKEDARDDRDDAAVGLKLFMGCDPASCSALCPYPDTCILGFQALVLKQ